jgi:hypothetical protein
MFNNEDLYDNSKACVKYIHNAYRLVYKKDKYEFYSCVCNVPFGVEEYNKKMIINLEIKCDTNICNNYVTNIKNVESMLSKNKIFCHQNFTDEIGKKYFISSLKKRMDTFLHRCHIRKGTNINFNDLIGKNVVAKLEADNIWIHGDTYGLIWYVKEIVVVSNQNEKLCDSVDELLF